ncbi:MAG: hypothetical protein SFU98_20265 [Leptospiraceae bacterium]|nr:hypothetical protein [Leptospiraceae bacterium]
MKLISSLVLLVPVLLYSWAMLFKNLILDLYEKWSNLNTLEKLILVFAISEFIFASRPWLEYKIQLTGIEERILVSAKTNLVFTLLSLGVIICLYIKRIQRRGFFFVIFLIAIYLFLILTYALPKNFLTDFTKKEDYSRTIYFYLFALSSIGIGIFGTREVFSSNSITK